MIITKEYLIEIGADCAGFDLFCEMFPGGYDTSNWTRDEQIRMYKTEMRGYLGWAFRKGILPMWSMENVDFQDADLRDADFRGANLTGADLRGADLRGADLRGADLKRADFRGANLTGADLRGAMMPGGKFYDPEIHRVNPETGHLEAMI